MKLLIRRGDALDQELELTGRDLRIGRGEDNDLVLVDPTKAVSRLHAELRCENGRYVLLDLKSQNGIWIDGKRQPKVTLNAGLPITLGPYTLTLIDAPDTGDETLLVPRSAKAAAAETSGTLLLPAAERAGTPAASQTKPAESSKRPPTKPGQPASAPGFISHLAKLPKPVLLGGTAALMIAIMALGQVFGPRKQDSVKGRSAVDVGQPAGPSNEDVKSQHLARAKGLLDTNDYDSAIIELDAALLAVPNDPEVVDLRARASEMKVASSDQAAPTKAPGESTLSPPVKKEGAMRNSPAPPKRGGQADLSAQEEMHQAAQRLLVAAATKEREGDLVAALGQYQRASQADPSASGVVDESSKRVRGRMASEGSDAFTRAKEYDAVGRVPEAIALYERAFRYLPDDDPKKKMAKDRLDALRVLR